ncbi:MAG: PorV/PorQ family protein [Elusimicrobiota bacterium]
MRKNLILTFYFFAFLHSYLLTASNTGASFLNIGTSARAISIGGAYVGIANDASAINYNPAGLSQLNKNEIVAQHTEWISDINHDFLAGAFPLKKSAIGFSAIVLSQGKIEGRDENRNKTDSFSAYDTALTLSYSSVIARRSRSNLSLGTNLKIIQQKIESETATGIAFDIGLLTRLLAQSLNRFTFGFSFQNLGPKMTFISEGYNLPLTATLGAGYNIKNALTLALDIKQRIYDNKTEISFGTEYISFNVLTLRVGYLLTNIRTYEHKNASGFSGFGGGLGFRIFNFSTDYAFVPYGDLGNTHRISFSVRF